MAHALGGIAFHPENIRLDTELTAAERANQLAIREGIPFREAYRVVARSLDDE